MQYAVLVNTLDGAAQARPRPAPTGTRRQRNRAQTEAALVDSAYTLLRAHGFDALTVELVAEGAGVSRRTFFNYFPTLADSVTYHVEALLDEALRLFSEIPTDADMAGAVREALESIAHTEALEKGAYLHYCSKRSDGLRATSLLVWERARRQLAQAVTTRYPQVDDLEVAVLVETLIGAFYAAFNVWSDHLAGEPTTKDTAHLLDYLRRALAITANGPLGSN